MIRLAPSSLCTAASPGDHATAPRHRASASGIPRCGRITSTAANARSAHSFRHAIDFLNGTVPRRLRWQEWSGEVAAPKGDTM